ncbi:MAG TPA: response regulator transcription factor [Phycicoccus sp.]|jgi:DNA-binding response OmpR family regulator|nr:response regulator transcription factor [Phycicoccus sp.]HQY97427.1 response regulator transcription factor [Phycicoccus sp.]HRA45162.1 response regulator transcription factor [Phycicoccus sp.]
MSSSIPGTPQSLARLLVVEDDEVINESLTVRFEAQGYAVSRAFDGPSAVAVFEADSPDLVVLDLMLPGFDGLEVCRRIQAVRPVPVLMLTARDDETDILVGLGVGADDYVTKPFRMREVVARVQALLRRVERAAELSATPRVTELSVGSLVLDGRARRAFVAGEEVHLTPLEFDLVATLGAAPGRVFPREDLLRDVWGWADAYGTRTLDSHVKSLRSKIGADRIRTVHGVGYALEEVR